MSLNAPLWYIIPEETARIAQAAFPKGTRFMKMRDVFGPIYSNAAFTHLFPHNGQPAQDPARLALILIMQFADGLSLLQAIYAPNAPAALRDLSAVGTLRQIWLQQYYAAERPEAVRWREQDDLPPGA